MGFLDLITVGEVALVLANVATCAMMCIAFRRLGHCCKGPPCEPPPAAREYEQQVVGVITKRKPVVNDDERAVRLERKQQEKPRPLY